MAESIRPKFNNVALMGPAPFKRLRITNSEINCGTAIVVTKIVRQTPLNFRPLVLIKSASRMPKKKQVTVANVAQISVQPKTGKKVSAIFPEMTLPKFTKPTQVKRFFGGRFVWS